MTAETSRIAVRYAEETVFNEIPAVQLQELEYVSESNNTNLEKIQSQRVRSDRNVPGYITVRGQNAGDINLEVSYGLADAFTEGALFSDWTSPVAVSGTDIDAVNADSSYNSSTTNFVTEGIVPGMWVKIAGFTEAANNGYKQVVSVTATKLVVDATLTDEAVGDTVTMDNGGMLRNGVTPHSYFIEKELEDVGDFFYYKGNRVNTMSLNVAAGSIVNMVFSFIGAGYGTDVATQGTGPHLAAPTTPILNAVDNVSQIMEGGSAVTGIISSVALNVNNNLRALNGIGSIAPQAINAGQCVVEGTLEVYFENLDLYNKFINSTGSSFSFKLADALGNAYIVTLPNIEFLSDPISGSGNNNDVIESINFGAVYDSTTGCSIQIDRFPV